METLDLDTLSNVTGGCCNGQFLMKLGQLLSQFGQQLGAMAGGQGAAGAPGAAGANPKGAAGGAGAAGAQG